MAAGTPLTAPAESADPVPVRLEEWMCAPAATVAECGGLSSNAPSATEHNAMNATRAMAQKDALGELFFFMVPP
jgi:hypothetical protein